MQKLLISGKAMGWIEVFLDHGLNGFRDEKGFIFGTRIYFLEHGLNGFRDEHRFIFGTRNYFGTRMERI